MKTDIQPPAKESPRSAHLKKMMAENAAKRKARRKSTCEDFTPPWLVNQMLDKLEIYSTDCCINPTKTFLDPCCGNGTMLIEVLKRKLAYGSDSVQALSTIYGLDIMADNIEECRERLLQVVRDAGIQVTAKHIDAVSWNIRWVDTKVYPRGSLDYDYNLFDR